jgi:cytochrome c5
MNRARTLFAPPKLSLYPVGLSAIVLATLALPACGNSEPAGTAPRPASSAAAPATQVAQDAIAHAGEQAHAGGPAPSIQMADAGDTGDGNSDAAADEETAAEQEAEGPPPDGGTLYATYCAVCHRTGLNAAPRDGDRNAWGRVAAKGREEVYSNAINGIRGMPARGGYAFLTDADIRAATDHMVSRGGGWREENN